MNKVIIILFFLTNFTVIAQPDTEVFIMDITSSEKGTQLTNLANISDNSGYDNQPSFLDNNTITFAKNNGEQTDIAIYKIDEKKTTWFNNSTKGGEYSPQQIPGTEDIAAVRLDPDGKQRLYRYKANGSNSILLNGIEVAYYTFFDKDRIVASILSEDNLDLVIANVSNQEKKFYLENTGRSIQKVPGDTSISYTAINEDKNHDVYLLDLNKGDETYFVCELPSGIQDYIWLDNSKIVVGSGSKLFLKNLYNDDTWEEIGDLSTKGVTDITRLAVSPSGKKIAIVAEKIISDPETSTEGKPSPFNAAAVVQKHIEPFNNRNLSAFVDCFSEDVKVNRFPDQSMYIGKDKMTENYKRFYDNNPDVKVQVASRIVLKEIVVDEEIVHISEKKHRQATIYEVGNGKIKSMTFISDLKVDDSPIAIVKKQLDAYNSRDIDAFMDTYSEDIKLYNYPATLIGEGKEEMRANYGNFFKNTPNLHCEIKNRIVIGNKVIDQEYVTINKTNLSAIAIYEVENGLISKVTFVQ